MTDYRFTFSVLFIVGSMIAQSISVTGADTPPETATTQTNQQQGMQDSLEGSIIIRIWQHLKPPDNLGFIKETKL